MNELFLEILSFAMSILYLGAIVFFIGGCFLDYISRPTEKNNENS